MNAPPGPTASTGALSLDLTIRLGADGRSRLASRRVSFPWSLGRGYPGPPGAPVTLIPQVAGAGLLAGDLARQRIRVEDGAALHLASAGAMLTHGAPGGRGSISDWAIDLGHGARAVLLSEPYVLFDDADLTLRQTITLPRDASLVSCEGICADLPGRRCWTSEIVVRRPGGEVLFRDRQRVSRALLARHAALSGAWTSFGTVIALSQDPDDMLRAMTSMADRLDAGAWAGATPTRAGSGVCVRVAAGSGQELRTALQRLARCACRSADRHAAG